MGSSRESVFASFTLTQRSSTLAQRVSADTRPVAPRCRSPYAFPAPRNIALKIRGT